MSGSGGGGSPVAVRRRAPRPGTLALGLALVMLAGGLLAGSGAALAQAAGAPATSGMLLANGSSPFTTAVPLTPGAPRGPSLLARLPLAAHAGGVWSNHTGTGSTVSLAPTVAPTVSATAQPTADTAGTSGAPTPITLTSNALAIFTTLGCLLGVIGLLALVIAWITLVSDGWGPMLKALIVGNRRGRLRFARRPTNSRARLTGPPGRATPAPRERGGWR